MKKFFKVILIILIIIVLFIGANLGLNKFGKTNLEQLSANDQQLISDLDKLDKIIEDKPLWTNFDLQNKPLVLANGRFKYSYIVNPQVEPSGLGVTKINLPSDYNISVYRMAGVAYNNLQFHIGTGNFNTMLQKMNVYGNEVFYIRYDDGRFTRPDATYIISFLVHEAFHYFMQVNWQLPGQQPENPISDEGAATLTDMYTTVGEMQNNIVNQGSDEELKALVNKYLQLYNSLQQTDNNYATFLASRELNEGTAQYVGYQANIDIERQSLLFPKPDNLEESYNIADFAMDIREAPVYEFYMVNMPYNTGLVLCLTLDRIGPSDWQTQLNNQTLESPIYIQDLLSSI